MILLLMFAFGIFAFDFKCPTQSQRNIRAQGHCNQTKVDQYYCLYDGNVKVHSESCLVKSDGFVPPGKKYIIQTLLDAVDCDSNRYQPFIFYINMSTYCVFQKSHCSEMGQLLSGSGSTKEDTTCRCDYTKGYAYVTLPIDKCNCQPSKEDCSCYIKQCPDKYHLSPDYQCIATLNEFLSTCAQINYPMKPGPESNTTKLLMIQGEQNYSEVGLIIISGLIIFPLITIFVVGTLVMKPVKLKFAQEKRRFENKIIVNWKHLKENLDPDTAIPILVREGLLSNSKYESMKDCSRNKKTEQLLICMISAKSNKKMYQSWKKIARKQNKNLTQLPNDSAKVPTWPKRNEEKCKKKLAHANVRDMFTKSFDPRDVVDDFLQAFIFTVEDYKEIKSLKTTSEMVSCFLMKIQYTLHKGSFECLLKVVQNRQDIHQLLKEDLPPAVTVKILKGTWYNTRLEGAQTIMINIKTSHNLKMKNVDKCSDLLLWTVKELTLLPISNFTGGNIELLPLDDNAYQRLSGVLKSGSFSTFLELIFENDVIESLRPADLECDIKITINNRMDIAQNKYRGIFNDKESVNIVTANRDFLEKQLDPSCLLKCPDFKKKYFDTSQNIREASKKYFDFLETEGNAETIETVIRILDTENCTNVVKRLQTYKEIHNADAVMLRSQVVKHLTEFEAVADDINDIWEMFHARKIFINSEVIMRYCKDNDNSKTLHFIIAILASRSDIAIRSLVDCLCMYGHNPLATKILGKDNTQKRKETTCYSDVVALARTSTRNLLYDGKYKVSFDY